MVKTTIFCPNCGTANRDEADICSECGSVIPKYVESKNAGNPSKNLPSPDDFGIITEQPTAPSRSSYPPPPPPPDQSYGITIAPSSYDSIGGYQPSNVKIVCERCGTVLRADDKQCSGCGKPISVNVTPPPPGKTIAGKPYPQQPSSYPSLPDPYTTLPPPPYATQPPPPKAKGKIPNNSAKCAKCGAIVYDYESRCSNCGRILAAPRAPEKESPIDTRAPTGVAHCGRCNAVVYPHQTICPNCSKPLAPVKASTAEPYQRMSRCRRCGHLVYPTDAVCPNCGRSLDPI
ncbi:MAG: zinc-ribbon domain-containing protein [Candidatus Thorarchaeota archaeon]